MLKHDGLPASPSSSLTHVPAGSRDVLSFGATDVQANDLLAEPHEFSSDYDSDDDAFEPAALPSRAFVPCDDEGRLIGPDCRDRFVREVFRRKPSLRDQELLELVGDPEQDLPAFWPRRAADDHARPASRLELVRKQLDRAARDQQLAAHSPAHGPDLARQKRAARMLELSIIAVAVLTVVFLAVN